MKILLDTLTEEQIARFKLLTYEEMEFVAQIGAAYLQLDSTKYVKSHVPMEMGLKLIEEIKG